jgi:hypothetical protein
MELDGGQVDFISAASCHPGEAGAFYPTMTASAALAAFSSGALAIALSYRVQAAQLDLKDGEGFLRLSNPAAWGRSRASGRSSERDRFTPRCGITGTWAERSARMTPN